MAPETTAESPSIRDVARHGRRLGRHRLAGAQRHRPGARRDAPARPRGRRAARLRPAQRRAQPDHRADRSTIGVVLPDIYGEFFSELIRGIDRAARGAGYHLLVSGSHSDAERDRGGAARPPRPGRRPDRDAAGPRRRRAPRPAAAAAARRAAQRTPAATPRHRSIRIDNRGGARRHDRAPARPRPPPHRPRARAAPTTTTPPSGCAATTTRSPRAASPVDPALLLLGATSREDVRLPRRPSLVADSPAPDRRVRRQRRDGHRLPGRRCARRGLARARGRGAGRLRRHPDRPLRRPPADLRPGRDRRARQPRHRAAAAGDRPAPRAQPARHEMLPTTLVVRESCGAHRDPASPPSVPEPQGGRA